MRPSIVIVGFAAMASLSLSAYAQSQPSTMTLTPTDSATVVDEVRGITRANFELSRAGRFEESFQRFARTCTGAADGKLILSWEEHRIRTVLPFLARLDSISFTLGDFVVTPLGRNVAIVVGKYAFSAIRAAQRLSHPSTAFTWVFVKRDNRWEIAHWHTSNP
jgi:hypothetical protein